MTAPQQVNTPFHPVTARPNGVRSLYTILDYRGVELNAWDARPGRWPAHYKIGGRPEHYATLEAACAVIDGFFKEREGGRAVRRVTLTDALGSLTLRPGQAPELGQAAR